MGRLHLPKKAQRTLCLFFGKYGETEAIIKMMVKGKKNRGRNYAKCRTGGKYYKYLFVFLQIQIPMRPSRFVGRTSFPHPKQVLP